MTQPVARHIRVLFLHGHYYTAFNGLLPSPLSGIAITLSPEILDLSGLDHGLTLLDGVTVDLSRTLNPDGKRQDVYEPPEEVLGKIAQITSEHTRRKDFFVVLGNNGNAGFLKAPYIEESVRARTIVLATAKLFPEEEDRYRQLDITEFTTRENLQAHLRALIDSLGI